MKLIYTHFVQLRRFGCLLATLLTLGSCSNSPTDPTPATALKDWRVAWEPITSSTMVSFAQSQDQIVGVGNQGTMVISRNGSDWSRIRFPELDATNNQPIFTDICWTGRIFVAVTWSGAVTVSSDGSTWESMRQIGSGAAQSIATNGNVMVVAENRKKIFYSVDGVGWVQASAPENSYRDVLWTGDMFLASTNRGKLFSSVDGSEWKVFAETDESVYSIVYNGSFYLGISFNGFLVKSFDGVNWNSESDTLVGPIRDLHWTGIEFVAGFPLSGSSYSVNGTDWIPIRTLNVDDPKQSSMFPIAATRFKNRLVIGSHSGYIAYSDGSLSDWEILSGESFFGFNDVTYGDNGWIAVGQMGLIMSSVDGVQWDTPDRFSTANLSSVIWTGSAYVAVGDTSAVFISPDGISWTAQSVTPRLTDNASLVFSDSLTCATFGNEVFCSEDLITWNLTPQRAPGWFSDLKYFEGKWIGTAGYSVVWSTDLINWNTHDLARDTLGARQQPFTSINWSGTEYLATGRDGAMMISTDLVNWTYQRQFYGQLFSVNDALWTGEEYLIVGGTGMIITTNDLENWINHSPPVNDQITAVATDGNSYITVSRDKSRIMISP